jgi:xanthine dehydrogenase YagS FAD-binding subunit
MRALAYERADDVAAAQRLAAEQPDAMYLAGGTNLVDLVKLGVARPALLIDLSGIGLDEIDHRADGSVVIGAMARNARLAGDPGIRERFPLLAEALLAGASGQLRTVASTAGNLLQRTRCVYFQDVSKPCNKRAPGSGCAAIEGSHRDLALLGTSEHCVASHPSDMAVAMVALDGVVHVTRAGGDADQMLVEELYREPGSTPERETMLTSGDIITTVALPAPPVGARMAYRKVRDRRSYAFALVSVAAVVVADEDGRIRDLRLGFGGVASRPWRARTAEARLTGTRCSPEQIAAAVADEFADCRPLPANAFKPGLMADTVAAVLSELLEGTAR